MTRWNDDERRGRDSRPARPSDLILVLLLYAIIIGLVALAVQATGGHPHP